MQVFTKLQTVFVILWLADQFSRITSQTCSGDNSVYGYMLRGNIFKTLQTALPFECSQACEGDVRCQSFNYVISKNTCELNDRTKKARPADFLPSSERYYYEKSKNRGNFKHFSVTQVSYCWLLWGATNTGYKVKPPFHNKQLSHSRLLNMRSKIASDAVRAVQSVIISYPTNVGGITVSLAKHPKYR